ncbi:T9SS type A sorting domain-containing protein [uncultured Draconibacterium sp.]|uniref:T9SS type A sorting domain-containing protein n=1 Tax=uncultured Draconibacterium sp. TaxID=1573823 RepID=UPI003216A4C8
MGKYLRLLPIAVFFFLAVASVNGQSVFINEVHYDNTGTDTGEAIEIAAPAGTDLTGWSVLLYNGSNGAVYGTEVLSGLVSDQSGGYGFVTVNYPTNGLQNGAPDGIALVDASNTAIQFLSYEGSFTAVGGPADGQTSVDIGVSEPGVPVGESLQLTGNGADYTDFTWQVSTANTFGAVNVGQTFTGGSIPIKINEIRIDQTSTDNDEYFELLGAAGQDLSGLTYLVIGDGTGGSGVIEAVVDLSGTQIAANGLFLAGEATMTIATPDFLTDLNFENSDNVTHLLVSGFSGSNGLDLDTDDDGVLDIIPWDEIVDDVAFIETVGSGDLVYSSFQVGPDGAFVPGHIYRDCDGVWQMGTFEITLDTPGATNCDDTPAATMVINELDADTEGTDALEFVELYDGGVGNTPLDGYVLVFFNGSSDLSYSAYDLDGYATDANGYFVIGNAAVPGVGLTFANNSLQNGADAVALYKGDASEFPANTVLTTDNLEDAIIYDTNDADDSGLLTLLNADEPQLNEDENGDKDFHSLQRYPNGSGGSRNTSSYVAALPTPGAANSNLTAPVTLVINEVDADTEGTDVLEFVELFDGGVGNTSLSGFVLVFYNGSDDASYAAYDLDGYATDANGYFVIGNSAVAGVGLTFPNNGLQNGADAVALYTGDATDFVNDTPVTTENLIDAFVYDTNDSDDTGLLVLLNAGEAQVNEAGEGNGAAYSSQRIPNGSGGARNTSTYAQAVPTPGAENGAVAPPAEPLTIQQARDAAEGTTITITGVLTVSDQFLGSAFMQDSTAGIAVFDAQVHGAGIFNIGDSIKITGSRSVFNDMVQISGVTAVEFLGHATNPVQAKTVTLAELSAYPGQLVKVEGAGFPEPGGLLFGNTNFELSDASGSGEMRLDADVQELVGLAQPESCEVTGVVGRFTDIYQLMPRIKADLPCATEYSSEDGLGISKDETLDIVAWNIEWFGDEGNSPAGTNADLIQKDSVKAVIMALNADIIGVEEISDDATFAQMISEIPGYAFILSEATSYPNDTGVKQKVGFIYNTATVSPVSTKVLLAAAHPYYNGGDESMLADYPDADKTRFFASGRLPFMLTADVTISGITEQISVIDLHARANTGDYQSKYDMRRYDVEALKDTLDMYYADAKIVMVGDYNDDIDETVAEVNTTESSFKAYVDDAAYLFPTMELSEANYRSYVFYPNMIDHIMISDEISANYISGSARVHYEFYDSDYTYTTSDHFPVSARLQIQTLQLVSISATDVDCNGGSNGSAAVEVDGGIQPYEYLWSNGETTSTLENLAAGTYSAVVKDYLGAEITASVTLTEPNPVEFSISGNNLVYPAYPDSACTTLFVENVTGGTGSYSIEWSTGETTESIEVCPGEETTYEASVIDENGCTDTMAVTVFTTDVDCSNNSFGAPKVQICYKGHTQCVSINAVDEHLKNGATLGTCSAEEETVSVELQDVLVYPNPFKNNFTVGFTSDSKVDAQLVVTTSEGTLVYSEDISIHKGYNNVNVKVKDLATGTYFVSIVGAGVTGVSETIIKQ